MTGPYERVYESQYLYPVAGRIELNLGGGRTVTATVLRGDATIELSEKYDDAVTAFGMTEPIRFVNQRQKLRLIVEADLDGMVIDFSGGADGEAATSPDSRRRS
jgi:hypothetical protein